MSGKICIHAQRLYMFIYHYYIYAHYLFNTTMTSPKSIHTLDFAQIFCKPVT